MPKRTDIKSILILGAGPIVIGQACEFDYSGAQACKALREEGYRVILVNSNPATIMTDPEMADATYIEPIHWEVVRKIIEKERPDAVLPTMGGQTALNCALELERQGVLEEFGVTMIGATADAIDKAEDRRLQHDCRGDTPGARSRPGHHGSVLRVCAAPAFPERTALWIKRAQRKLKDDAAHQELFAKRRAEHRGQDGKKAGIAHACFLDKLAVIGRRLGQQRQHSVGHVANDHLQGKADHDNAGDAPPCFVCSPAKRALALPARHEGAGPQIAPPQQRHQKRCRLRGGLKPLNIEVVNRETRQLRHDVQRGEQNHAQGNIGSNNTKTGKRPRYRIEHANLLLRWLVI